MEDTTKSTSKTNSTGDRNQDELVRIDQGTIDRAVLDLNRLYTRGSLETVKAIGEYLLETFFDGDFEHARSRVRKDVSLRALAERDDLLFSPAFLSRSLGILEQLKMLPGDIGASLSVSHHKILLAVKSERYKRRLAANSVQ